MRGETLTTAQLRSSVALALISHGLTVDQFAASDIDDLDDSLRDMRLMTSRPLRESARPADP